MIYNLFNRLKKSSAVCFFVEKKSVFLLFFRGGDGTGWAIQHPRFLSAGHDSFCRRQMQHAVSISPDLSCDRFPGGCRVTLSPDQRISLRIRCPAGSWGSMGLIISGVTAVWTAAESVIKIDGIIFPPENFFQDPSRDSPGGRRINDPNGRSGSCLLQSGRWRSGRPDRSALPHQEVFPLWGVWRLRRYGTASGR